MIGSKKIFSLNLSQQFAVNINSILGIYKVNKIGVAVSGGSDSMALLHLLLEWSRERDIKVTIFSVDHNLREESKLEISYIKNLSKNVNCNFIPLSWHCGDKNSAIQERARKARYELIDKSCNDLEIPLLLTAHHLDDMLETYLIKKSKKSSALALAPNITYFWNNLWIIRPLFNIQKRELVKYLLENNIKWFEDKSNKLDKYERNRVRKKLESFNLKEKTLLITEYNTSIDRSRQLNARLVQAIAEVVSIYNYGFAKINIAKFIDLDIEIRIHVMNYVLAIVGGKDIPRYRSLVNILSKIDTGSLSFYTLNHCKLVVKNNEIIVHKEKKFIKKMFPTRRSDDLYTLYWDNRFEITLKEPNYSITSLNIEDYSSLRKYLRLKKLAEDSNNTHKSILFTLPVIKSLEKVIAIPHISYYDNKILSGFVKIVFKPSFVSRFTHFF